MADLKIPASLRAKARRAFDAAWEKLEGEAAADPGQKFGWPKGTKIPPKDAA